MQIVSASKYLSAEERKMLLQKNDWLASLSILKEWAWVVFAFALSYFFPNILAYIISIFILGGKQLACAILMHDASHYALFNNKNTNNFVGQWLGAFPILQDVHDYRPYHIKHHQYNGLEEDPDLLLTRGYPTSRASMIRKFTRDLTGQTAIKITGALFLMKMGYLEYGLGNQLIKTTPPDKSFKAIRLRAWKVFAKPVLANFIILISRVIMEIITSFPVSLTPYVSLGQRLR